MVLARIWTIFCMSEATCVSNGLRILLGQLGFKNVNLLFVFEIFQTIQKWGAIEMSTRVPLSSAHALCIVASSPLCAHFYIDSASALFE